MGELLVRALRGTRSEEDRAKPCCLEDQNTVLAGEVMEGDSGGLQKNLEAEHFATATPDLELSNTTYSSQARGNDAPPSLSATSAVSLVHFLLHSLPLVSL